MLTGLRAGTTLVRSSDLADVFTRVDFVVAFALFETVVDFLLLVVVRVLEGLVFAFPAIISPSDNLRGL
ncbi:MAG: hypothetical protein WBI14_05955 [Anaerolineaceae bacterium]